MDNAVDAAAGAIKTAHSFCAGSIGANTAIGRAISFSLRTVSESSSSASRAHLDGRVSATPEARA